ncbi:MAG TPA: AraC family ligand binding domain-containing protein [Herpetosiphonaceae bacterium]
MSTQPPLPSAILVDLAALAVAAHQSGPRWSHESADLDLTLLSWPSPQQIAPHVNDEVDVLLIGVQGSGEVTVNAATYRLVPGMALLIPKGAQRSMRSTDDGWSYLSVHRRRRGLWPTVRGEPLR